MLTRSLAKKILLFYIETLSIDFFIDWLSRLSRWVIVEVLSIQIHNARRTRIHEEQSSHKYCASRRHSKRLVKSLNVFDLTFSLISRLSHDTTLRSRASFVELSDIFLHIASRFFISKRSKSWIEIDFCWISSVWVSKMIFWLWLRSIL